MDFRGLNRWAGASPKKRYLILKFIVDIRMIKGLPTTFIYEIFYFLLTDM